MESQPPVVLVGFWNFSKWGQKLRKTEEKNKRKKLKEKQGRYPIKCGPTELGTSLRTSLACSSKCFPTPWDSACNVIPGQEAYGAHVVLHNDKNRKTSFWERPFVYLYHDKMEMLSSRAPLYSRVLACVPHQVL